MLTKRIIPCLDMTAGRVVKGVQFVNFRDAGNPIELAKKYDALIIGWSLGVDPDDYSIWHSSQYPAGLNFIGYRNRKADRLLEQGRTTIDRRARKLIYAELDKVIAWDQPYVFLWYPKSVVGVRDRVGGLSKPGPAGLFLHMEKVFVSRAIP